MAIRKIREIGDEVLTKVCKEVTKMTPRTTELIDDMLETMYEAMGGRSCCTTGWNSQKNRCHRYRRRSGCYDQPTHRREQRRADRGRRMS